MARPPDSRQASISPNKAENRGLIAGSIIGGGVGSSAGIIGAIIGGVVGSTVGYYSTKYILKNEGMGSGVSKTSSEVNAPESSEQYNEEIVDPPQSSPTVLIIEDEQDIAELYEGWLEDDFEVRKAIGGKEGLDLMDESVDIVLVDRRMPEVSGDQVLAEIRKKGYAVPIVMLTAVEPDYDIIEMGFDDYLIKPFSEKDLLNTVERILRLSDYNDAIKKYDSGLSKLWALRMWKSVEELEHSPEFEALELRLQELQEDLDAISKYFEKPESEIQKEDRGDN